MTHVEIRKLQYTYALSRITHLTAFTLRHMKAVLSTDSKNSSEDLLRLIIPSYTGIQRRCMKKQLFRGLMPLPAL